MAKADLKVVRAASPYNNTGNTLIDLGGSRCDALANMHDFAEFLVDVAAHDPGDSPGPSIRHGRYLALVVLAESLAKLGAIEQALIEGGNHGTR